MADRLKAIAWKAPGTAIKKGFSRAALMEEYFRRAALWLDAYGEPQMWPFFDLAEIVDPSVRVDPVLIEDIELFIDDACGSSYAMDSGAAAVQWAALTSAPGVQLPPLPDPFEPLLRLYERGGASFQFANGFIDFGMIMVPRGRWRGHLALDPVVELDDRALDVLDAAGWARFENPTG
ncbi:hypothetical protein [Streptomyces sp. NRRL WC-3742]|uniref:hypothetical protein n=1 Tax=Streptomyces sp. NRRL WC-3742 TaxID=1463934 RepID=UPI00068D5E00|nr:hypothetical protein [Streptomyces sp. NRRL WC-3742]